MRTLLLVAACVPAFAEIIETKDFSDVSKVIQNAATTDVIFLDVDDNIITVSASMFRYDNPARHYIDELKKNRANIPNFYDKIAKWRRDRKVQLVNLGWPDLIKAAIKKQVPIYALTQMDTGAFGPMKRVEEWRYKELQSFGINFTTSYNGKDDFCLKNSKDGDMSKGGIISPACFYKGIFLTGAFAKGEIIKLFLDSNRPSKLIFVDDRKDHVKDVEKTCIQHNIPFIGIVFRGTELVKRVNIPPELVEKVTEMQKQSILDSKWIEDAEALEAIQQKKP